MTKFIKRLRRSEKGQALTIVLALLAVGSLTIAVNLNYATTSLKGSGIVGEDMRGVYAAGAGVEYALWYLKTYGSVPTQLQLSENVSQMAINTIRTETDGQTYTFYFGGMTTVNPQYWKLSVNGTMTSVGGNRYKYEITALLTGNVTQTLYLEEVGARIPVGYHYDNSLSRSDDKGLHDPNTTQDGQGAELLNWTWMTWGPSLRPRLDNIGDSFTQTFYVTGTGTTEGEYAWVRAQPDIIDIVGEFTGKQYRIVATATRPQDGKVTAEIVADITKMDSGPIAIRSWQITQ